MSKTDAYSQALSPGVTAQTEQADPRQELNNAGGFTFTVDALARAKRFLILGSDAGSYYQKADELTKENAQSIVALVGDETLGPQLVAMIEDVSVRGLAQRQQPTIFALAVASTLGTDTTRRLANLAVDRVCRTGTHILMFARYVDGLKGWSRGRRGAVADWFLSKDADGLAYQMLKYRQRDGWSMADALRIAHPKTTDSAKRDLFEFITKGRDVETLEGAKLPGIVEGFVTAQGTTDPKVAAAMVREHRLSWEMLPDSVINSTEVWDALIDNGLPHGALIRQLPRLTKLGIVGPMFAGRTHEIVAALTDQEKLNKARVHPVSVLTAMKSYSSGGTAGQSRGEPFKPVTAIVDALDEAFYKAFESAPRANKRTLIGLDVSGSMGGHTDANGILTAREVGAAMSLVLTATEPGTEVYGFTAAAGGYGGRWGGGEASFTALNISPKQRLNDVIKATSDLPFGGTDCALPMVEALKHGWEVDTFIVITDNETWAGAIHPHEALAKYRKSTGIDAKLVVLAVTPTKFSIADPTDLGMLDIPGFGSDVPALVTNFSAGF